MRKRMLRYALILAAICSVAALGLSGTYYFTALKDGPNSPIPRKLREKRGQALALLFSSFSAEYSGEIRGRYSPVYIAVDKTDKKRIVAYAAEGSAKGYSSRVRVLALVDSQVKKVLAILITDQKETPGLGTRIADVETDVTWGQVLSGDESLLKAIAARYEPPESLKALSGFEKQFIRKGGIPVDAVRLSGERTSPGGKFHGINSITGATTSSKAVIKAVNQAIRAIKSAVPPRGGASKAM